MIGLFQNILVFYTYIIDALDKKAIHIHGGMEGDGMRFCHDSQHGTQFKTYQLFISGIFHVIFSDHG